MADYAAFDLEIAKIVDDGSDWAAQWPLGISCAAIAMDNAHENNYRFWYSSPRLLPRGAEEIVRDLENLHALGRKIVTFNGAGFDFKVLAYESGELERCARLALEHYDIMFMAATRRGHYIGLDSACEGMYVPGKLKSVQLKDGSELTDMSGAKAPELWRQQEFDAVLAYLKEDVRSLLDLTKAVAEHRQIRCISKKGKPYKITMPRLYTVKECLTGQISRVVPRWLKDPVDIWSMVDWIPDNILNGA